VFTGDSASYRTKKVAGTSTPESASADPSWFASPEPSPYSPVELESIGPESVEAESVAPESVEPGWIEPESTELSPFETEDESVDPSLSGREPESDEPSSPNAPSALLVSPSGFEPHPDVSAAATNAGLTRERRKPIALSFAEVAQILHEASANRLPELGILVRCCSSVTWCLDSAQKLRLRAIRGPGRPFKARW
jgi:hypothetical protein